MEVRNHNAIAHRALTFTVAAMAVLGVAFALAHFADARVLPNGEGVWLKPLRFALAFAIHAATLLWISHLTLRWEVQDRLFAWSVWLQVGVIFVELACIGLQAGRGVASHFNYATAFDRVVFTVMGVGTGGLFLGFALIVVGLVRKPGPGTASVAVMIAMAYAMLGGLAGVAMVMPTAAQAALLEQGVRPEVIGSHLVGAASQAKVPFFGWDMSAGDWRVPHFLGLHALQMIPFIAWLAMHRERVGAYRAVWFGALGYGLIFAWSILQTLAGRSLFRPDAVDVAVVLVAVVVFLLGIAQALQRRWVPSRTPG
jgi:hypothetical protein